MNDIPTPDLQVVARKRDRASAVCTREPNKRHRGKNTSKEKKEKEEEARLKKKGDVISSSRARRSFKQQDVDALVQNLVRIKGTLISFIAMERGLQPQPQAKEKSRPHSLVFPPILAPLNDLFVSQDMPSPRVDKWKGSENKYQENANTTETPQGKHSRTGAYTLNKRKLRQATRTVSKLLTVLNGVSDDNTKEGGRNEILPISSAASTLSPSISATPQAPITTPAQLLQIFRLLCDVMLLLHPFISNVLVQKSQQEAMSGQSTFDRNGKMNGGGQNNCASQSTDDRNSRTSHIRSRRKHRHSREESHTRQRSRDVIDHGNCSLPQSQLPSIPAEILPLPRSPLPPSLFSVQALAHKNSIFMTCHRLIGRMYQQLSSLSSLVMVSLPPTRSFFQDSSSASSSSSSVVSPTPPASLPSGTPSPGNDHECDQDQDQDTGRNGYMHSGSLDCEACLRGFQSSLEVVYYSYESSAAYFGVVYEQQVHMQSKQHKAEDKNGDRGAEEKEDKREGKELIYSLRDPHPYLSSSLPVLPVLHRGLYRPSSDLTEGMGIHRHTLNQEINILMKSLTLSTSNARAREHFVEYITQQIHSLFPVASSTERIRPLSLSPSLSPPLPSMAPSKPILPVSVLVYGSAASGLLTEESDLDIQLLIHEQHDEKEGKVPKGGVTCKNILSTLASHLKAKIQTDSRAWRENTKILRKNIENVLVSSTPSSPCSSLAHLPSPSLSPVSSPSLPDGRRLVNTFIGKHLNTRIPLLRLQPYKVYGTGKVVLDPFLSLPCDVDITAGISYSPFLVSSPFPSLHAARSDLLKRYTLCDDRVRPLILLVKTWAHARDVGDAKTGGLNSYAWSLMTIQFLQILDPPVVPVLGVLKLKTTGVTGDDVMKNSPGVKKAIGCDSATTHFRSDNSLTTSQLFRLFHHYYAFVFRPSRYRISVYSGRPLPLDVENGANDVAMEYTGKTRDHKNNNESNVHDLTSHHNHTQRKHTHAHALKIKHIPKLALVVEDPVERQDFPSRTLTSTGLRRLAREHMRVCVCFSLAEQKQTIAQTYAQTCPQAHTGTRDDTPRTCIRGHCSNNGLFLARFSINKINIQSHCHTPSLSASTSPFPSSAVALHSDHTLQWRDIALPLSCLPSIITRGKDRVCSLFFGV